MDQQAAIGAAVAILRDGEVIEIGGFGKTSVEESGVNVTPHTLFAYGSISKTICAALIMRLVEQGLLDLDQRIAHYLPDLKFSDPVCGEKITLRHILSHTSGLPAAGKDWGPRDPDSLRRFVDEQIPHYVFHAEPGGVYLYSNTAFCIAGRVAEAVTGTVYEELVQAYVFAPLQMDRATYDPAIALTYPVALPHELSPDGDLRVTHKLAYNASGNPSGFALGSVSDLANLAQMFLNQGMFGSEEFLRSPSVAEMQKPHASRHIEGHAHPLAHANQGYALGFFTGHYKGRRAARHGGMSQSFNCFFDLFPDDRAGVVLLTNYSQEQPLMELLLALYDRALDLPDQGILYLERPAVLSPSPNDEVLRRYTGSFLNVESGRLAIFTIHDNVLLMDIEGESSPLVPFEYTRFFAEVSEKYRLPVVFLEDREGQVTHVMITGEPYFLIEIDPSFQPDLQLWKTFEGIYMDPSNPNPDEVFTIRLEGGTLYINEDGYEVPGRAIGARCFLSELGMIEFKDTGLVGEKVLVLGKATRYYPKERK
jgi:CubicO group peptidase (beta-lactamase class C family)